MRAHGGGPRVPPRGRQNNTISGNVAILPRHECAACGAPIRDAIICRTCAAWTRAYHSLRDAVRAIREARR